MTVRYIDTTDLLPHQDHELVVNLDHEDVPYLGCVDCSDSVRDVPAKVITAAVDDALLDLVDTAGGEWRYFASRPTTAHTVEQLQARVRKA